MRPVALLLTGGVWVSALSPGLVHAETLQAALSGYGVTLEPSQAPLETVRDQDRRGERLRLRTIEAEGQGLRVEVRVTGPITSEQAARFSATEYLMIEGLYRDRETPYAGQISKTVACPEPYSLKKERIKVLDRDVSILVGAANERKLFGVCDPALFHHTGVFLAVYLPGSSVLLEFRIFTLVHGSGVKGPDATPARAFLGRLRAATK